MSNRAMIYELLEQAHETAYPTYTVGQFMKAINYDIGPLDQLADGEVVARLSGFIASPFHLQKPGREDL